MKKIYQNPEIKIVMVQPTLMETTSIGTGNYTGGAIQSREGGSFWEDDDDEEE